jgi:hypothetical protein
VFAAYAQHGAAAGAPLRDLSSTLPAGGPPMPLFVQSDTLNRAALEKLDTSTAVGARGGARGVAMAVLAGLLLASVGFGATALVLRGSPSAPSAAPPAHAAVAVPSPTVAVVPVPSPAVAVVPVPSPAVAAVPAVAAEEVVADAGVARSRGGVGRRSRRAAGAVGAAPLAAPMAMPTPPAARSVAEDLPP